jgi:hypothetical protein
VKKPQPLKKIDKPKLMLKDCREFEGTFFAIATQKISIDLDGIKVELPKSLRRCWCR